MDPEQLIARVQELTGRLEDLEDESCRDLVGFVPGEATAEVTRMGQAAAAEL